MDIRIRSLHPLDYFNEKKVANAETHSQRKAIIKRKKGMEHKIVTLGFAYQFGRLINQVPSICNKMQQLK